MSNIVRARSVWFVLVVLFVASPDRARAADATVAPRESSVIQLSADVQPEVARMLLASPTFRSQYLRIARAANIRVGVRVDPTPDYHFKARSMVRRYYSGLIVVEVLILPGSGQGEWIAHEFEHILEQLDGVNLAALAGGRGAGVWYSGEKSLETNRAIRAGRAVHEELRRRPILKSDSFVE